MLKKLGLVLMVAALGLTLLAGCRAEEPDTFKVALLLPGNISDQGWNATAYNGLKLIEQNMGAEIAYMEKVPQSDFEEVFRRYAEEGYDLIFGHGFQFGDAAKTVAAEFEDIWFVVTSTTISQAPNVASLNNDAVQAGFICGALSALVSESQKVAMVGGMNIPSITGYLTGFENGAKYINPDITVLSGLTGDFYDAAKAKEMAIAFINEGADVVSHDADQAGLGVIEAAQERDLLTIGAIADQAHLAPEHMITSVTQDLSLAYEIIARKVLEGTIEPKSYFMGVNEGTVRLTGWGGFESIITQDVKDRINQIVEDIGSGAIDPAAVPGS